MGQPEATRFTWPVLDKWTRGKNPLMLVPPFLSWLERIPLSKSHGSWVSAVFIVPQAAEGRGGALTLNCLP